MNDVVKVGYTARLEAIDRTVPALDQARIIAGAPGYAKFRYSETPYGFSEGQLTVQPWDEPRPVAVEFYWEEEIG